MTAEEKAILVALTVFCFTEAIRTFLHELLPLVVVAVNKLLSS